MAAPASAAGSETPKQLLSIIRDFASEKSHGGEHANPCPPLPLRTAQSDRVVRAPALTGRFVSRAERRVSDLRRRLADVRAAADAAAAELDAAKRAREAAEQELRGSQVQAAIADATIQALEVSPRLAPALMIYLSRLQCACFVIRITSSKGDSERDEFISKMHEMNAKIRQFQQMVSLELVEYNHSVLQSAEGQHVGEKSKTIASDGTLKDLAAKANNIDAEVQLLEGEYKKDLLDHDKVRQELADVQAKRALMEAVMAETKQLQELGGYPEFVCRVFSIQFYSHFSMLWLKLSLTWNTRAAELEKVHASLADELQRRYTCPSCGVNNMPGLEEAAN
ncbi:hypothetical protein BAE44_0010594 [Dichanthelium oligosanthes]|uniref:Uncharacterized protein n=1 Tax=Dichanthelium oligosanthes TaxID=888268 RepID=A0A1E5VTE1_9POAL|nr:hypothetical protein BAE44_0010594 [Dichanthelium oligosanthes]